MVRVSGLQQVCTHEENVIFGHNVDTSVTDEPLQQVHGVRLPQRRHFLLPLADWRVAIPFVNEAWIIAEMGESRPKACCNDASKYNNKFTSRAHAQVPW